MKCINWYFKTFVLDEREVCMQSFPLYLLVLWHVVLVESTIVSFKHNLSNYVALHGISTQIIVTNKDLLCANNLYLEGNDLYCSLYWN